MENVLTNLETAITTTRLVKITIDRSNKIMSFFSCSDAINLSMPTDILVGLISKVEKL